MLKQTMFITAVIIVLLLIAVHYIEHHISEELDFYLECLHKVKSGLERNQEIIQFTVIDKNNVNIHKVIKKLENVLTDKTSKALVVYDLIEHSKYADVYQIKITFISTATRIINLRC